MRLVIAIALLAGACGDKQASKAPSCAVAARAIDSMVKRAKESATERTEQLDAIAPRWRAVIANRCADDKWPADAIACHANVTTMDELRACRRMLTEEQQARLLKQEVPLMDEQFALPGLGDSSAVAPNATAEIARLEAELRQLNVRLGEAMTKVADATSDAERSVAQDEVRRLQTEMARVNRELDAARKDVERSPVR